MAKKKVYSSSVGNPYRGVKPSTRRKHGKKSKSKKK